MPVYDVECADCGFSSTAELKIAALGAWDAAATCPACQARDGRFRRVIKQAPLSRVGGEGSARSETARKLSLKQGFRRSAEKDHMLHKASQRRDADQVAAARESAKKGDA